MGVATKWTPPYLCALALMANHVVKFKILIAIWGWKLRLSEVEMGEGAKCQAFKKQAAKS